MKINVLGTEYAIEFKSQSEDKGLKEIDGYCNGYSKQIVIENYKEFEEPQEVKDEKIKENLRHEIIHAFLNESGLKYNSTIISLAWAKNEEMVDWIAIQFPKILKVYQELDIL